MTFKNKYMRIREATPNSNFWNQWKKCKSEIKKLGISIGKRNNKWQVSQWENAD